MSTYAPRHALREESGPEAAVAAAPGGGGASADLDVKRAWGALWALLIGFFMLLVDSTIVTTAMPAIMTHLNASINGAVWVTSSYLLSYAAPLLVTGRLGDRYGPRNLFMLGLVIFTASSAWCGFSHTIGMLITARAVQGIGAAMMAPQSMSVITRMFPPTTRGAAMGVWGATAGVATLVGPILGGVLVDAFGWQWIFFVNVPVGIFAMWRIWVKVPDLERHSHSIDWLGISLSSAGLFLVVFGIQEGNNYNWGTMRGPITVWRLIILGALITLAFLYWQARNHREPLLPLKLFGTWNFAVGNMSIFFVGIFITAMAFPNMLYLQKVRDLSPTRAALMMAPMAVISGGLAPLVGKLWGHKAWYGRLAALGLALFAASLFTLAWLAGKEAPLWQLLVVTVPMGIASSVMWGPISIATTRDLSPRDAGAGSGVYNETRQLGSVIGSALISFLMTDQITREMRKVLGSTGGSFQMPSGEAMTEAIPQALRPAFGTALAHSMWLPAGVAALGAVVALLLRSRSAQAAAIATGHIVATDATPTVGAETL